MDNLYSLTTKKGLYQVKNGDGKIVFVGDKKEYTVWLTNHKGAIVL